MCFLYKFTLFFLPGNENLFVDLKKQLKNFKI